MFFGIQQGYARIAGKILRNRQGKYRALKSRLKLLKPLKPLKLFKPFKRLTGVQRCLWKIRK